MLGKPRTPRSLRISVVKDDKAKTAPGEDKELRPETVQLVTEKSKEVAKYVAFTVVAAYAAFKTIDTLSKIAVKKTKSADNKE